MTDLRKAAEQALGALETHVPHAYKDRGFEPIQALRQALSNEFNPDWNQVEALQESLREHMAEIQRLRQALAQPEQVLTAKVVVTGIEHEPYGYVWTSLRDGMEVRFSRMPPNKFYSPQNIKPVYTAPPKREWVGLTDDEIEEHFLTNVNTGCLLSFGAGAAYAEAKLKEKNT